MNKEVLKQVVSTTVFGRKEVSAGQSIELQKILDGTVADNHRLEVGKLKDLLSEVLYNENYNDLSELSKETITDIAELIIEDYFMTIEKGGVTI